MTTLDSSLHRLPQSVWDSSLARAKHTIDTYHQQWSQWRQDEHDERQAQLKFGPTPSIFTERPLAPAERRWVLSSPSLSKTGRPLGLSWTVQVKERFGRGDALISAPVMFVSGLIGHGLLSALPSVEWNTSVALGLSSALAIGKVIHGTWLRGWKTHSHDLGPIEITESAAWKGRQWIKSNQGEHSVSTLEFETIRAHVKKDIQATHNTLTQMGLDVTLMASISRLKDTWLTNLHSAHMKDWMRVQEQVQGVVEQCQFLQTLQEAIQIHQAPSNTPVTSMAASIDDPSTDGPGELDYAWAKQEVQTRSNYSGDPSRYI